MNTAVAPGKIILSGEYAVVFGYPGIAVPASLTLTATFEEGSTKKVDVVWKQKHDATWDAYLRRIVDLCHFERGGVLTIESGLPLGKGMGSSTALVIASTRALLGENCRDAALAIEDTVNPGHSGIDFNIIWENRPLLFQMGHPPTPIDVSIHQWTKGATLIDTGAPSEITMELVAWMRERQDEPDVIAALRIIARCTERLLAGEDVKTVIRDHHHAQVALGVVPPKTQELIKKIEQHGGAAKVIGAGGRAAGAGIVFALGPMPSSMNFPVISL